MNDTTPEVEHDIAVLYRRAFAQYGKDAIWSLRPVPHPTPADALAITKSLRTHGGMEGRRLAEQIERLCCWVLFWKTVDPFSPILKH